MSYRPICDVWLLARPKHKYYGGYPAGFLHRAVELLGVGRDRFVACVGVLVGFGNRIRCYSVFERGEDS